MIEYKGYTGVFEYDEDYEFFAGRVIDTRDGINFEGRSVSELKESMRRAVDDYLHSRAPQGDRFLNEPPPPCEILREAMADRPLGQQLSAPVGG